MSSSLKRDLVSGDISTVDRSRYYNQGGSDLLYGIYNETVSADYVHTIGKNTPGFHSRVRKGELIGHTPFTKYSCKGAVFDSVYDYTLKNPYYHAWTNPSGYAGFLSPVPDWWVAQSYMEDKFPSNVTLFVQEAASKIYSNGFDALTFLAEFSDVKKLFTEIGRKFMKLDFPRNWRQMTNDWLNYRYGWRPLMYDLKELHDLVTGFNDRRKRYSERSGCTHSYSYSDGDSIATANWDFNWFQETHVTISHRGSVVADIDVPKLQFNPIQTAWELIPYSFVIDWFVSVGRSIATLSFLLHVKEYRASWGVRVDVNKQTSVQTSNYHNRYVSGELKYSANCDAYLEWRRPCGIPTSPHYLLRLDNLKILDLIGLVLQRI